MVIKKKIPVQSLPASMETVWTLYPDTNQNKEDREKLISIVRVLLNSPKAFLNNYTCYIEKTALEKFLKHANEVYNTRGNEATGLFVGYYLHHLEDSNKKIAIVTDFLPAYGNTTITCEISHEDAAQNAEFCNNHKVLPLVWPHTHPFNRPLFYSCVDSLTLASVYSAPHQMGVVCDNLRNAYKGFKIINGKESHESLYCLDLQKSLEKGILVSECLYKKPMVFGESKDAYIEKKAETEHTMSDASCATFMQSSELYALVKPMSRLIDQLLPLLVIINTVILFLLLIGISILTLHHYF